MPLLQRKRYLNLNHAGVYAPAPGGGALGLQTSLGSFFSLDNTLADATGAVTNLTNNNTVTFVSPPGGGLAAVTNCANFVSASSQFLSHADATGINVGGIDFSIQFWFYVTGTNKAFAFKQSGGFGSREYGFDYPFATGGSNPVRSDFNNFGALSTGNFSTSAWHHCVTTFNNTSKVRIIYIDGTSAATDTVGGTSLSGTSTLNIGADAAGTGSFYSGNMALYGTWRSRVLSAGDVTLLYNGGAGLSYAAMA